jgi:hypothetical protein
VAHVRLVSASATVDLTSDRDRRLCFCHNALPVRCRWSSSAGSLHINVQGKVTGSRRVTLESENFSGLNDTFVMCARLFALLPYYILRVVYCCTSLALG